jgi:hypothetical protein
MYYEENFGHSKPSMMDICHHQLLFRSRLKEIYLSIQFNADAV